MSIPDTAGLFISKIFSVIFGGIGPITAILKVF